MIKLPAILTLCCCFLLNAQSIKGDNCSLGNETGMTYSERNEQERSAAREDYRFEVSFGPDSEGYIGRIFVKAYTPQSDEPAMEFERDLVERLAEAPSPEEAARWVNDTTDINFDGIPDLMVYIGLNAVGRVSEYYDGFVWDDEDKCFAMVPGYDEISNPIVHPDTKTITSTARTDAVEITTWTYAWVDGYLEIIDETTSTFGDE